MAKKKVGSKFHGPGDKTYMIVGACNGSPSGSCFVVALNYGWSYTGKVCDVEDCHDITEEEFSEMVGGHVEKFRQYE